MKNIIANLQEEKKQWIGHAKAEKLGGNVIKEAHYMGTATGIQIAINMLLEEKKKRGGMKNLICLILLVLLSGCYGGPGHEKMREVTITEYCDGQVHYQLEDYYLKETKYRNFYNGKTFNEWMREKYKEVQLKPTE